jgi:hypothetical protein
VPNDADETLIFGFTALRSQLSQLAATFAESVLAAIRAGSPEELLADSRCPRRLPTGLGQGRTSEHDPYDGFAEKCSEHNCVAPPLECPTPHQRSTRPDACCPRPSVHRRLAGLARRAFTHRLAQDDSPAACGRVARGPVRLAVVTAYLARGTVRTARALYRDPAARAPDGNAHGVLVAREAARLRDRVARDRPARDASRARVVAADRRPVRYDRDGPGALDFSASRLIGRRAGDRVGAWRPGAAVGGRRSQAPVRNRTTASVRGTRAGRGCRSAARRPQERRREQATRGSNHRRHPFEVYTAINAATALDGRRYRS